MCFEPPVRTSGALTNSAHQRCPSSGLVRSLARGCSPQRYCRQVAADTKHMPNVKPQPTDLALKDLSRICRDLLAFASLGYSGRTVFD